MVEIATSVDGVVAARMTGAGFGGCTVNLVRPDAVAALRDAVRDALSRDDRPRPDDPARHGHGRRRQAGLIERPSATHRPLPARLHPGCNTSVALRPTPYFPRFAFVRHP